MNLKSGLMALLTAGLLLTGTAPASGAASYDTTVQEAARALPVAAEDNLGYDRDLYFGRWADPDGDCQDTRAEVLIRESKTAPDYTSQRRCTVANSRWLTTFDDRIHKSATTVQVDHTVPAHEAWGSGARSWTQDRRIAFYNDLDYADSLSAQSGTLVARKQALGPEEWVPPVNRCTYIAHWIAVKARWGLTADPVEKEALIRIADGCPPSSLTITEV
ncbi:HNH endonuclease family protein [Arthrobacter sp. TMN-37]